MGEQSAPPEFLVVGHILAPHGIKGELKIRVMTDFPDRFLPGNTLYIDSRPLEIDSSRPHKQHLLIKLAGIATREDAEKLGGRDLTIPRSEIRALSNGEYYAFELIDLEVVTTDGNHVGRIIDLITTASNDVYVVQGPRGEVLIPAIENVVKSIDIENGKMVIEAIEGLLGSP